jgi:hypothetical protein
MSDVYSGNDTIEIDGKLIADFADGDVAVLSYPNQKISKISGDNGNTITVENASGRQAQLQLRILNNSKDFQYLQLRMSQQDTDLVSFASVKAVFTKITGDGNGKANKTVVSCFGGNFVNGIQLTKGKSGNVEVGVAVFTLLFSRSE